MRDRDQYIAEIERIVGDPVPGDGKIETSFHSSTAEESRALSKRLALMQKELRLLRKDASADARTIRASHVAQRSNVQAGFWAGALGGRGGAARDRKNKRLQSKAQEEAAVQSHLTIAAMIDTLLVQIDHAKLQTDQHIRDNPTPKASGRSTKPVDAAAGIRALKEMLDEGLITEDEYASKKADLLARM
jgi:hypothetical protein